MAKYCYFPILKTRPAEVNAYDMLDSNIKEEILPIIEMTGELGYTYSQKCKDEKCRGMRRPGDINKKIPKILDFMENRRFILDITDDPSLKYDGLSSLGSGLLNPEQGYKNWIDFLSQNETFKKAVIPTIQFDTKYMDEVEKQIHILDENFDFIALKLPVPQQVANNTENILPQIIKYVTDRIQNDKLFVILDFGYILTNRINVQLQGLDMSVLKALIPVSSSFPSNVTKYGKTSGHIDIIENKISENVKQQLGAKVFHGDFSSIHPIRYEMGGGGWYPRIDFIERDSKTQRPLYYRFFRSEERNTSSEYVALANNTITSSFYRPINEIKTEGDLRIKRKSEGTQEGRSPSYWIATRSNIYMTMQYLYLRKQSDAFLFL